MGESGQHGAVEEVAVAEMTSAVAAAAAFVAMSDRTPESEQGDDHDSDDHDEQHKLMCDHRACDERRDECADQDADAICVH
jgi:hypothetical protein